MPVTTVILSEQSEPKDPLLFSGSNRTKDKTNRTLSQI
jgi:hypothetical protein